MAAITAHLPCTFFAFANRLSNVSAQNSLIAFTDITLLSSFFARSNDENNSCTRSIHAINPSNSGNHCITLYLHLCIWFRSSLLILHWYIQHVMISKYVSPIHDLHGSYVRFVHWAFSFFSLILASLSCFLNSVFSLFLSVCRSSKISFMKWNLSVIKSALGNSTSNIFSILLDISHDTSLTLPSSSSSINLRISRMNGSAFVHGRIAIIPFGLSTLLKIV